MSGKLVETRSGYGYDVERVTPVEEIPKVFQNKVSLFGGGVQVLDSRLCYNWRPGDGCVECGSVATHAEQEGFVSPEKV